MSMMDSGGGGGGADDIGPNVDGTAVGASGPSGPGPGAQGAPPGGGPILAALARRMQGPQTSAPGPGDNAHSMTMIMQAIAMIQQALPGLMPGSPLHKDALKAAQSLSRHAPQGAPTLGVQQTQLMDLLRNIRKNSMLSRIMGGMQNSPPGGGGGGGPSDQPAGPTPGGQQQAPMPSTPLPGA